MNGEGRGKEGREGEREGERERRRERRRIKRSGKGVKGEG